ncbi:MAG: tetratricopeptide repeat protein [Methanomicrobiaceae archaeon]|nr:tetratricopeptide repeat protein [Methanomicrobiaceae archaeon]
MKVGVRYWYNKGVALLEAEMPEKAVECFDRALKEDTENSGILFKKGIALFYSKKFEEAGEIFNQIIKKDSSNYPALNNRGMTLLHLNQIQEARICFERAKELSNGAGCADLNASLIKMIKIENR